MSLVTTLAAIEGGAPPSFDYQLHNYLTDDADWKADHWDIEIPDVEAYCKHIQAYFDSSERGIEFQALWVGETPSIEVTLELNELLELIQNNLLGTRSRYVVSNSV